MNINMRILTDIICISACVYCIAYYTKCLITHEAPLYEDADDSDNLIPGCLHNKHALTMKWP